MRRTDDDLVGRRPQVATLDTGCGTHPWLAADVVRARPHPRRPRRSGTSTTATDPETWSDQAGPLDGGLDGLAGHGTFIAGLIHQACPDADIVAWRVVGSDGPMIESDLVKALSDITEVARRHRDGEQGGHPIDVLNMSIGYYHETPQDVLFDPTMYDILRGSASAVSPSCARRATTPPTDRCFPAAWCPWADPARAALPSTQPSVPVVTVGALNPNGTDALFSNVGPWVRAHAAGAR